MAVALEQFVKHLEDSGVLSSGTLEKFVPPKAQPKDAQELARQLVKQKHLTKFQAQQIYQGKAKSLILGNYTILDKIGAGGMGQVFKAEHRRMERVVAIKMLPPAMTKDDAAVARFQREVVAAAKLRHPNIVAADDADEANGVHFLVMEYVEGKDLSALVKKNGPFSVQKVVNFILQAAKGLEFAHSKGVIHRDIKPANLLLDTEGTVKILDMGLARIEAGTDTPAQAELTGTGAVMGTVDYMAPEQALSTKHADARADVYSLGCSLYYLLSGNPAYDGETVMARLLAHRESPIPSLVDVQADVSDELQVVFEKMVAKKAEDRYQSMSEVIVDLEQCQGGSETSVVSNPSLGMSSDSGLMTFLKDVSAETTQKPKSLPTEQSAVKEFKKRSPRLWAGIGAAIFAIVVLLAGIIISLQGDDGTLVVQINQPDAVVKVLNEKDEVEITRPGEKGKLTISVDPGKHRLRVEKEGFHFFTKDFSLESGGKETITAKLVPLDSVAGQPDEPWNAPTFQQWMSQVAAMPAEKQVEAVSKKLVELNPGFDGKVTYEIKDGEVEEFGVTSEAVSDIAPIGALVGLKYLACYKASVSDLSPLKGMKLASLSCGHTLVSDLSALQGMPLATLACFGTQVSDLSPLKGMPLTNLQCQYTQISDLSPLKGMPLTRLRCHRTNVTDLSPLSGMPLTSLECDFIPKRDTAILRSVKTLQTINGKPAEEFWKDIEAE